MTALPSAVGPDAPGGPDAEKTKLIHRLRRLEGQLRGLQRMVQEDQPCGDILTQLSSVRSALNATGDLILETYLEACQERGDGDPAQIVQLLKLAR